MSQVAYLSGPMTGYPDDNRPAFKKWTKHLRMLGYEVISPDELDGVDPAAGSRWEDLIRRDIPHLTRCNCCFVMPGWRASRGATLETLILNQLGVPVFDVVTHRRVPPEELPTPEHQSLGVHNPMTGG